MGTDELTVLDIHEVAQILACHESTVYRMIKRKQAPPSFKVGSDHRFLKRLLVQWMTEQSGGNNGNP